MAVGKGSMDRASRAAKNQEAKNTKAGLEENVKEEKEIIPEEKEMFKEEVAVKKTRAKKPTNDTKKTEEREKSKEGKKEVKAAVIGATDSQVMELLEKDPEKNKDKEVPGKKTGCGIGDEMPIYFL